MIAAYQLNRKTNELIERYYNNEIKAIYRAHAGLYVELTKRSTCSIILFFIFPPSFT